MRTYLKMLPIIAILTAATPSFAACFAANEPGATVEGVVEVVERRHPTGTKIKGYVVRVGAPICLNDPDALDDVSSVRRLHVVPSTTAGAELLRRRVGATVRVTGAPMSAHTHYHLAPVVLLDAEVTKP